MELWKHLLPQKSKSLIMPQAINGCGLRTPHWICPLNIAQMNLSCKCLAYKFCKLGQRFWKETAAECAVNESQIRKSLTHHSEASMLRFFWSNQFLPIIKYLSKVDSDFLVFDKLTPLQSEIDKYNLFKHSSMICETCLDCNNCECVLSTVTLLLWVSAKDWHCSLISVWIAATRTDIVCRSLCCNLCFAIRIQFSKSAPFWSVAVVVVVVSMVRSLVFIIGDMSGSYMW